MTITLNFNYKHTGRTHESPPNDFFKIIKKDTQLITIAIHENGIETQFHLTYPEALLAGKMFIKASRGSFDRSEIENNPLKITYGNYSGKPNDFFKIASAIFQSTLTIHEGENESSFYLQSTNCQYAGNMLIQLASNVISYLNIPNTR